MTLCRYVSFELIFKHGQLWLTVPSAASDNVLALKAKLAKETGAAAHDIRVYLPAGVGEGEKEQELVAATAQGEDMTLLNYGISHDRELRFEVTSVQGTAGAHRPPLYVPSRNDAASLAAGASLAVARMPVGSLFCGETIHGVCNRRLRQQCPTQASTTANSRTAQPLLSTSTVESALIV